MEQTNGVAGLLDPTEVAIDYQLAKDGEVKTERFMVGKIPAFTAHRLHASTTDSLAHNNLASLPTVATLELMKYAAHNGIVLGSEALVNAHCENSDVVLAVALAVWERNFGFFDTEGFQSRLATLRKIIGA